jgi:hypothetical protein
MKRGRGEEERRRKKRGEEKYGPEVAMLLCIPSKAPFTSDANRRISFSLPWKDKHRKEGESEKPR